MRTPEGPISRGNLRLEGDRQAGDKPPKEEILKNLATFIMAAEVHVDQLAAIYSHGTLAKDPTVVARALEGAIESLKHAQEFNDLLLP